MAFGIEETGRDQELFGPTGLPELLIHPGIFSSTQARFSDVKRVSWVGLSGMPGPAGFWRGVSRAMKQLASWVLNCRSAGAASMWQANHSP